jgi:hypothetical protein
LHAPEATVKIRIAMALLALAAFAQPALAQGKGHGNDNAPGQGQGQGKGRGQGQGQSAATPGTYVVADRDRNAIYGYYRNEFAAGNCPPGLAKKNNGCLPPGQAKKLWAIGQPLPAGLAYYPLPPVLMGQLTPAPAGYQYARVGSDILMLAAGTGMVVAALADLGAM